MKTKIAIFLFCFTLTAFAEVTLQDCQSDAQLHGDSKTPVKPLPECADIIQRDPASVSVKSSDKKWNAYAHRSMLYLDSLSADEAILERSLLAGEETELVNIEKIFIDTAEKKLIVIQTKGEKSELMLFDLNFLGNVSPLKVMRSNAFKGVTSARFQGPDHIEVVNGNQTFIVNADAESRSELSSKKAMEITPQ